MGSYSPLKITGYSTGLVQNRENFLLPDDAYPVLQNAFVFRERILRKKGYQLLGRLQRNIGTTDSSGSLTVTLAPLPIQTGLASFVLSAAMVPSVLLNDPGTTANPTPQALLTNGTGGATLNRTTGELIISGSLANASVAYFPGLPVMGIRIQEKPNSAFDQTIVFDQNYAYVFVAGTNSYTEWIPGTTWNAHGGDPTATDFFWSTNWFVSANPPFSTTGVKLFWVTNNTGQYGALMDPIRVTDGTSWVNYSGPPFSTANYTKINTTNYLYNCLALLPFRGRLMAFNTWEGASDGTLTNYPQRIRWSIIGNPFVAFVPASPGVPSAGSWNDFRSEAGYLDIPTAEDIISVGFVRDNMVIYCERSTWQLRYNGRSIDPFQIERVNSELGVEGPFSTVQFDTSLMGIGDKGVVECDSYKSERIDIKIPDLVFQFQNAFNGPFRVHGIRNFITRLAYWTFPLNAVNTIFPSSPSAIFPSQRLVYNYDNDSWAIFNDSLTTLGTYQPQSSRTWLNTPIPWIECNFPWISQPVGIPAVIGGNQQGFVEYLDKLTTNDESLFISNILGSVTNATVVTSPNHNMASGFVIRITGIAGTTYQDLNGGIFGINYIDANNFSLWTYNNQTMQFSDFQSSPADQYQGGGLIQIRENFYIQSKKFNFLDEGQNIQLGYLDILMSATEPANPGAISLNVYLDYDGANPSNTLPKNEIDGVQPPTADMFFNAVIPTTPAVYNGVSGTKFWQRVYCATRASFLTLQYTLSNAQMAGPEQALEVQIDAQVLWIRKAGRMTQG